MGKSSPSPPPAPDPYATASAQGTSNANTATAQTALNNANVYSPYGSTTYQVTGSQEITNPDGTKTGVPTYTQTNTLSPNQQTLLGQNEALGIQTNNIAADAQNSIGWTLAHPLQSSDIAKVQTSVGAAPSLATSYNSGQVQTGYDPGGALQSSYASGGTIANSYDSGGAITRGYDSGGAIQKDVNLNANAPTTFGQTAGRVQYGLGNTDFTADRNAATQAVLDRLAPGMAASDETLNAQLASQGLVQGSAAWNAAKLSQSSAQNDLRLGAVATGDAEQQALYGERLSTGQFNNAAQQQDYTQQQGRGAFAQAGIAQNNAATLDMGNFHNSAQDQQNRQNAAAAAFANAAQGQANSQNAAAAAFSNSAQAQGEQENAARAAFSNATQGQQNAENQAAAAFYNSATGQQAQQNAALAAFGNSAATQDYQNRLSGAAFHNQASGQQLSQAQALANQEVNQISALRSGGQVTPYQGTQYQAGTLDQTPISADVYQTAALQNDQYKAELQANAQNTAAMGSALGGIFGGVSKMGMKSDRRLKSEVACVAFARNGLPIYRYRLAGEPGWHLGFMADEVALIHPCAVWTDPHDGWARVDYEKAVA